MGFFSKLFSKIVNGDDKTSQVNVTAKVLYDPNIPPLQGDYAKTIFLWAHEKASTVRKNEEYARYFLYECGIANPNAYHLDLIRDGYFEKAPLSMCLNSFKVAELKQFLVSIGQVTTGKKAELIDRLCENADEATLRSFFKEEYYILSEKAKEFVKEHKDYVLIHQHKNWQINWKEYDSRRRPGYSFFDIVWGIFNERVLKEKQNCGRNSYYNMYELLREEGKREQAIEMLLRVLYIDVSGSCGFSSFNLYKEGVITKKELLESFDIVIILAPGIIGSITEYKDIYNDSIVDCVCEHKLPVQVCDKALFLSFIHSVFDGTYDEEAFVRKLKSAYAKFVKAL